MANINFSFIVPVYNRPDEIEELLESMLDQDFEHPFEVVIVEDGSTMAAEEVVSRFANTLQIAYFKKENSGPGDSRNFGMKRAKGNYFVILDSDCILPPTYLSEVYRELNADFVHCFGGGDTAHSSFSHVQKAIDYAMTAIWTTGGIRGKKWAVDKFQPRSFNMGISREAFIKTEGFGSIHPGEDPDLTFRIWNAGYTTRFFPKAFVYHKRRVDWEKFSRQMRKFGMVRPILNLWHPTTAKLTYWFPSFFSLGLVAALLLTIGGWWVPLLCYGGYFLIVFVDALAKSGSLWVTCLALVAVALQFFNYGYGFLKSSVLINFSKKQPELLFPELFYQSNERN